MSMRAGGGRGKVDYQWLPGNGEAPRPGRRPRWVCGGRARLPVRMPPSWVREEDRGGDSPPAELKGRAQKQS